MSLLLLLTSPAAATPGTGDPVVAFAAVRADVARLLRARTRAFTGTTPLGTTGDELGTFTDDTRPTGHQVDDLIPDAAAAVVARVGLTIPVGLEWIAKRAVALRTAMLVELSYFPEQANTAESIYQQLKDLYADEMTALGSALMDNQPGRARHYSLPVLSPALTAQASLLANPIELLP